MTKITSDDIWALRSNLQVAILSCATPDFDSREALIRTEKAIWAWLEEHKVIDFHPTHEGEAS